MPGQACRLVATGWVTGLPPGCPTNFSGYQIQCPSNLQTIPWQQDNLEMLLCMEGQEGERQRRGIILAGITARTSKTQTQALRLSEDN